MSKLSKLSRALHDVSYAEIAESVGIELDGGLRDSRYSPFIQTVKQEINADKPKFESAFEKELEEAEKLVLRIVKRAASKSIDITIAGRVDKKNLRTPIIGLTESDATNQKSTVSVDVNLSIFTGMRKAHGQVISDAKYLMNVVKELEKIGFYGFSRLYLERNGRFERTSLTESTRLPTGQLLHATDRIQVSYVTKIPNEMIPEIYEQHKQEFKGGQHSFYRV